MRLSKIPRLCRDVFTRYGGNDAWNVSAHYVYRKIFVFLKSMYERQVLLADTIIRDLPRLRDTEAISRDIGPLLLSFSHFLFLRCFQQHRQMGSSKVTLLLS
jgi:hypothetical protein